MIFFKYYKILLIVTNEKSAWAIIRLNAIIFINIVLKFENFIEIVLHRSYQSIIFKKQPITFILTVQILFKILYS